MLAKSHLKGYLLEEALVRLLRNSGYRRRSRLPSAGHRRWRS
ncbi:hypothetical protein [Kitasatospora griseola]|nr:hypothetical protein [Kitasatospora griseola]